MVRDQVCIDLSAARCQNTSQRHHNTSSQTRRCVTRTRRALPSHPSPFPFPSVLPPCPPTMKVYHLTHYILLFMTLPLPNPCEAALGLAANNLPPQLRNIHNVAAAISSNAESSFACILQKTAPLAREIRLQLFTTFTALRALRGQVAARSICVRAAQKSTSLVLGIRVQLSAALVALQDHVCEAAAASTKAGVMLKRAAQKINPLALEIRLQLSALLVALRSRVGDALIELLDRVDVVRPAKGSLPSASTRLASSSSQSRARPNEDCDGLRNEILPGCVHRLANGFHKPRPTDGASGVRVSSFARGAHHPFVFTRFSLLPISYFGKMFILSRLSADPVPVHRSSCPSRRPLKLGPLFLLTSIRSLPVPFHQQ